MKFTKQQLTQIISEGIKQGLKNSKNQNILSENVKVTLGMQGANVDAKAPGDTKRVARYIDSLDGVPEFMSAVPMFIEYLLEYDEEKANIDHLRKAARQKFDEMGANKALADLFVTVIQRASKEMKKAKRDLESAERADKPEESEAEKAYRQGGLGAAMGKDGELSMLSQLSAR